MTAQFSADRYNFALGKKVGPIVLPETKKKLHLEPNEPPRELVKRQ